ncbi:MAG TPA: hypothetical protein VM600_06485 [Actinomycetota bacterium]|nr:hypothetical protein [Actinomycetota bacterium]
MTRTTALRRMACAVCFGLLAFAMPASASEPVAIAAVPKDVPQGATGFDVLVSGADFKSGVRAETSSPDVVVDRTTFNAATSISLKLNVAQSAQVGAVDLIVRNNDGGTARCDDCLNIVPAPVITDVQPRSLRQGDQRKTIAILGERFSGVTAISFPGGGITVNGVTPSADGKLLANINVSSTAAPGDRPIEIATSMGARSSCTGCFSVIGSPPAVHSTSPAARGAGTVSQSVRIHGAGFAEGITVRFTPAGASQVSATSGASGITVDAVAVDGATRLTATISIDPTAQPGPRDISIVNTDGNVASCTACFSVSPAPSGAAPVPPRAPQGVRDLNVTLTGANFMTGARGSFEGAGIDVIRTVVQNATTATLTIRVDTEAATTRRDVYLTNPDGGRATCPDCFEIIGGPAFFSNANNEGPIVPNVLTQGMQHKQVKIFARNVAGTPTVTFAGGGVVVHSVTPSASDTFVAVVSVGGASPISLRDVIVTGADGGRGICGDCVSILPVTPSIRELRPNVVSQTAEDVRLQIVGSNFRPGVTVSFDDPGITAVTEYSNVGTLYTEVTVSDDATPGVHNVTLIDNQGNQFTCERCFTVNLAPKIASITPPTKMRGANRQDVVVNGKGLLRNATYAFGSGGVTIDRASWISEAKVILTISVAPNASLGEYTLTATNPDRTRASCRCFQVVAPPTVPDN